VRVWWVYVVERLLVEVFMVVVRNVCGCVSAVA